MRSGTSQVAVRAVRLEKEFRRGRRALAEVNLTISRGAVHGFIGENGAGKSTLLRLVAGLQRPTRGTLEVLGRSPWRAGPEHARRVATVMHPSPVDRSRSVAENARFMGSLAGVHINVGDITEKCGADSPGRRVGKLSLGMQVRLRIALAQAIRPSLLLLDEAFNALDLGSAFWLREVVRELVDEGCTVIVASHVLHEVVHLCDAVTILRGGSALVTVPSEELLGNRRTGLIRVSVPPDSLRAAHDIVSAHHTSTLHRGAIEVSDTASAEVCMLLGRAGIWPTSMVPVERSIEDVVLGLLRSGSSTAAAIDTATSVR